jgi:hypothetical protein
LRLSEKQRSCASGSPIVRLAFRPRLYRNRSQRVCLFAPASVSVFSLISRRTLRRAQRSRPLRDTTGDCKTRSSIRTNRRSRTRTSSCKRIATSMNGCGCATCISPTCAPYGTERTGGQSLRPRFFTPAGALPSGGLAGRGGFSHRKSCRQGASWSNRTKTRREGRLPLTSEPIALLGCAW